MRPFRATAAALPLCAVVYALSGALAALQVDIDPRDVTEAVTLGQSSSEADRTRFHQPYHLTVARPPLDSVDIVTPFRRVVVVTELRARAGDRRFGQREALAIVDRYPRQVSVHLDLTFHPQNTLVLVPQYDVRWVTARGVTLPPATVETVPRYFPKTGEMLLPVPPGLDERPKTLALSAPMLGATVVATFLGPTLARAEDPVRELVVSETGGTELARLRVDLTKLR